MRETITMKQGRILFRVAVLTAAVAVGSIFMSTPTFSQDTTTPPEIPAPPSFSLAVSPILPLAGDRITVAVVPQNFDTASTTFTWFRNDALLAAASGLGRSQLTVATDPTQSETIQIRARANFGPEFEPMERTVEVFTLPNPEQGIEIISELKSSFSLEVSNPNPNPGENVTVRVTTFAFDKGTANYRWLVNGVVQKTLSGKGNAEVILSAGAEGEVKVVGVEVTTADGLAQTREVTIRSVSATLYWWADTTVPYWYKGKALPSVSSRVTVLALPNTPNAASLAYQWEFNSNAIPASSGIGKSAFSFPMSFPVEEQIDVTMKDLAGTFSKTATLGVKPVTPTVNIYEVRPLRGVAYERILYDFSAPAGDPYDFIAAPFNFPKERERNLNYSWTFNGQKITGTFDKPWLFTITSKSGEVSLTNQLAVEVTDSIPNGARVQTSLRADFH